MDYIKEPTGHDDKVVTKDNMEEVFENIYKTNRWRKGDGSGSGSEPKNAQKWFKYLLKALRKHEPVIVHDFGCGSYHLYKEFAWPSTVRYTGYDVSDIALQRADLNCINPYATFEKLLDYNDLPGGNMILIKEVFQHWHHDDRVAMLESLQKKYKWVIVQGAANCTVPPDYTFGLVSHEEYPHEQNGKSMVGIWKFNNDPEDNLPTSK